MTSSTPPTGHCVNRPEKGDGVHHPAIKIKSILLSADVLFQSGAATLGLAAETRRSLSVTERVKQMEVLNHLL